MKIIIISIALFASVIGLFIWYQAKMHGLYIPDLDTITPGNKGLYGDSFGALTSLFTGLAFAGLIVTILLQQKELKAQSSEFSDMNENHKESIKLQSMNILYNVYQDRIDRNANAVNNLIKPYIKETDKLMKNRDFILDYFENKVDGIEPTGKSKS